MIFIITDGEPNDDKKTKEIINSATIEGIEVCTFVLNEDGKRSLFQVGYLVKIQYLSISMKLSNPYFKCVQI